LHFGLALVAHQDPATYYARIEQAIVGSGGDPLSILEATGQELERIVEQTPVTTLRKRPHPGKWTPNEILGHLVDAEVMFAARLRLVLCEDNPTFAGWDQERWVAAQRHNEGEPREHVRAFIALREVNLPVWRSVAPAQLARAGVHSRRGPETLGQMLRITAGHDLLHLDQLRRYVAAARNLGA
jgi:hypothetical protein